MSAGGPFDVVPVLVGCREFATRLATGASEATAVAPPAWLVAVPGNPASDGTTLSDFCAGGVIAIQWWCTQAAGPGAKEWPAKLSAWLDDWENDFRRNFDGDERAGYAALLTLLLRVERALAHSFPIDPGATH